jgi:hydrogenase maturation protease
MRTLILGLGNPILSDDSIGIRIANLLKERCKDLDAIEASAAGFRIIDEIVGYDKLIIIDSIKTGSAPVGTLFKFSEQDFNKTLHFTAPHDLSFFEAFEIMQQYYSDLPKEIVIYAIEVADTSTFSEYCTPQVESAIPVITERIITEQRL